MLQKIRSADIMEPSSDSSRTLCFSWGDNRFGQRTFLSPGALPLGLTNGKQLSENVDMPDVVDLPLLPGFGRQLAAPSLGNHHDPSWNHASSRTGSSALQLPKETGNESVPSPDHRPQHCTSTAKFPFSRVAGSGDATLLLHNLSGKLYFVGQNRDKLFSDEIDTSGDGTPVTVPTFVDYEEFYDKRLNAIAVGESHVCAITDQGLLFSFGASNEFGQLGHGILTTKRRPPGLVKLTLGIGHSQYRAKQVACGNDFSLVLTEAGEVFAFGSNSHGQCGAWYGEPDLACAVLSYSGTPGNER